jgi:hypothetical protein
MCARMCVCLALTAKARVCGGGATCDVNVKRVASGHLQVKARTHTLLAQATIAAAGFHGCYRRPTAGLPTVHTWGSMRRQQTVCNRKRAADNVQRCRPHALTHHRPSGHGDRPDRVVAPQVQPVQLVNLFRPTSAERSPAQEGVQGTRTPSRTPASTISWAPPNGPRSSFVSSSAG